MPRHRVLSWCAVRVRAVEAAGGEDGPEDSGVRVCQNEDCGLPQNRDRTGAANIGVQFGRLMRGEGPIRPMSAEEEKFHDLNVQCAVCE